MYLLSGFCVGGLEGLTFAPGWAAVAVCLFRTLLFTDTTGERGLRQGASSKTPSERPSALPLGLTGTDAAQIDGPGHPLPVCQTQTDSH